MNLLAAVLILAQDPASTSSKDEREARALLESVTGELQAAAALRVEANLTIKAGPTLPQTKKRVSVVARDRTHVKVEIASDFFDETERTTVVLTPGKHVVYNDYLQEYESAETKLTPKNMSYLDPATEFYMQLTVARLVPEEGDKKSEAKWALERAGGVARVTLTVTRFESTGPQVKTHVFDVDEVARRLKRYDVTVSRSGEVEMRIQADYSRLDLGGKVGDAEFEPALPKTAKLVAVLGDPYAKKIASFVGKPMPDLALESLDGKKVALKDDLRGKTALVVFWSRWLPACNEQAKQWAQVRANVGDADFDVVAVSCDDAEALAEYESDERAKFTYRRTDKTLTELPLPMAAARSMPVMVVVDRKGVIRSIRTARPSGAGVYEQEVKALLKER